MKEFGKCGDAQRVDEADRMTSVLGGRQSVLQQPSPAIVVAEVDKGASEVRRRENVAVERDC